MSLDITIKLNKPILALQIEKYEYACSSASDAIDLYSCSSLIDRIHLNITHNMTEMAKHINCVINTTYQDQYYFNRYTLYEILWTPNELDKEYMNTTMLESALRSGIKNMIIDYDKLQQYNPTNNWGSYHSFLHWLIEYWEICKEFPDCEISIWS